MKNEKFTQFTEMGLTLGRTRGWEQEIKAKERVAWELHEQYPPVGSLVLAHLILQQKTSYVRPDVGTKEFARTLATDAFKAVNEQEQRDCWDFYYLGLCHVYGRGTPQSYALAAEAFSASNNEGNPYAKFEEIWARHLAGGSRLDAILDLAELRGPLADYAAYSERALGLLGSACSRDLGSRSHLLWILLCQRALNDSIYHDHGSRQIRIAIERELREGVEALKLANTPRAHLALYLTARISRSNPTGKKPIEWFNDAIDPAIEELQILCRRGFVQAEEYKVIAERAEAEGWLSAPLAILAASQLQCEECEYEEDSLRVGDSTEISLG